MATFAHSCIMIVCTAGLWRCFLQITLKPFMQIKIKQLCTAIILFNSNQNRQKGNCLPKTSRAMLKSEVVSRTKLKLMQSARAQWKWQIWWWLVLTDKDPVSTGNRSCPPKVAIEIFVDVIQWHECNSYAPASSQFSHFEPFCDDPKDFASK